MSLSNRFADGAVLRNARLESEKSSRGGELHFNTHLGKVVAGFGIADEIFDSLVDSF